MTRTLKPWRCKFRVEGRDLAWVLFATDERDAHGRFVASLHREYPADPLVRESATVAPERAEVREEDGGWSVYYCSTRCVDRESHAVADRIAAFVNGAPWEPCESAEVADAIRRHFEHPAHA